MVRGGGGGGWLYTVYRGVAWTWNPHRGKSSSLIPEAIGAGDLKEGKVFMGPRGALMCDSHWELCFLRWMEKGWVKLHRSGRKSVCIP